MSERSPVAISRNPGTSGPDHQTSLRRRFASGVRRLKRSAVGLWRDEGGAWLVVMGFVLPVLIGVAGLGTEASLLFFEHRSLQSAADAAAYSAAVAYSYNASADITTQATDTVAGYGFTVGTGTNQANVTATTTTVTTTSSATWNAVQVTISRPQSTFFASLYLPILSNSVSATAVLNGSNPSGNCMLALGKDPATGQNNENGAIDLQGNVTLNMPGCGIYSNSSADNCSGSGKSVAADDFQGSVRVTAASVASAGCISFTGSNAQVNLPNSMTCDSSDSSACPQGSGAINDPYAGMTIPSTPAPPCHNQPGGSTLSPGRYCGITANGNLTLSPGTYIVDCSKSTCSKVQGQTTMLTVKNGTLSGTGVTLVFTCSSCTKASDWPSDAMQVAAGGTVSLTAPLANATLGVPGFAVIGDPNMPVNTLFDAHSNPSLCLGGTVYAPSAQFDMGGTPTGGCGGTICQQIIANTLYFYGNASFNSGGCSLTGGQKPIGSIVTLVD